MKLKKEDLVHMDCLRLFLFVLFSVLPKCSLAFHCHYVVMPYIFF